MNKSLLGLLASAVLLGGCSLIPDYQQPDAPVAAQWPQGPAYSPSEAAGVAAAFIFHFAFLQFGLYK